MNTWYTSLETENPVIISSRIRLARNLKKYPFSAKLKENETEMLNETISSIKNDRTALSEQFAAINMKSISDTDRLSMLERHLISPEFLKSKRERCLLLKDDESVSIMVNEEDHIRIQSIYPGDDLQGAWNMVDNIDNLIEETLEYAFDKDFGYLTSCPTNTGTALRASYMVHLPMLERTGHMKSILDALTKFGMTIRGTYGEASEAFGSIYQISNQLTLGKSETEIIEALKNITSQVIESEMTLRNKALKSKRSEIEDNVYRSYGILTNCRRIKSGEAMKLLSDVRLGYSLGILDVPRPKLCIYHIIMNIQPGNLRKRFDKQLNQEELYIAGAEYLREIFKTN